MSGHRQEKLAALHETLLHGKLPRNLHWTEVLELVGSIGQVEATHGTEFAFTIGTQREFFKRPHGSELGIDDVSRLRRLLKTAALPPETAEPVPSGRMVVVIDHHAAHIFHDLGGSRPQGDTTIEPYDPHNFHHHLVHRKESHYRGDRVPEETSFYEEVAKALLPATAIVLIGHGTGKSSAVDALVEYLKKHRPDVLHNVVANETADLAALTAPDIEAIAKRHLIPAA
jgi:hypothetical protein